MAYDAMDDPTALSNSHEACWDGILAPENFERLYLHRVKLIEDQSCTPI